MGQAGGGDFRRDPASSRAAAPLNPAYREEEFSIYFSDINVTFFIKMHGATEMAADIFTK